MSRDSIRLDINDRLRCDPLAERILERDSGNIPGDQQNRGCFAGPAFMAVLGLFLQPRWQENPMTKATKIEIENVVSPGRTTRVNAAKYEAMKKVMLRITPTKSPGLSAAEMREKMLPMLPQDL